MRLFGHLKRKDVTETYWANRRQVFRTQPADIGLRLDGSDSVFGVVVDIAIDKNLTTMAIFGNGSISLFCSNGDRMVGLEQDKNFKEKSLALVTDVKSSRSDPRWSSDHTPAKKNRTKLIVLTNDGFSAVEARSGEFRGGRHPLSALFRQSQELMEAALLVCMHHAQQVRTVFQSIVENNVLQTEALLNGKITADMSDKAGFTPLMFAASLGKKDVLKMLIARTATIDLKDRYGYTALMYSCNCGHRDAAEILIKAGAGIHEKDNDGATPIMIGAKNGYNGIVRTLLAAGADPVAKDRNGFSAVDLARRSGLAETVRILLETE